MPNQEPKSKPESAEQPSGEGLSSSALFGLAVMLERTVNDGWKTTVTTRQLLGYRYADSEDAAVGSFLRKSLADNEGFTAGQVLVIPIPLPNVERVHPYQRRRTSITGFGL
jgi:hypothetical protein